MKKRNKPAKVSHTRRGPLPVSQGEVSFATSAAVDRSPRSIFSVVIAPGLLAILISAGAIKTIPIVSAISIDLTTLFVFLVVAAMVVSGMQLGLPNGRILVFLAWPVLLLPAINSPTNDYATTKITLLATISLLLGISPFFLLRNSAQVRSFLISLCGVSIFTGIAAFMQSPIDAGRLVTSGGNTIDTGRIIGLGALILLLHALSTQGRPRWRFVSLCIGILLLLATISTGSRGPLFAILFALTIALFFARYFRKFRVRAIIVAGAVFTFATFLIVNSDSTGFERIEQSLIGSDGDSSTGRFQLWQAAVETIVDSPLGVGWGGFSELSFSEYPHNVLLEILLEAGWLTGSAVIALLFITFLKGVKESGSFLSMVIFSIYSFALINAMFSSDINGNRLLIVATVTIWVLHMRKPSIRSFGGRAYPSRGPGVPQLDRLLRDHL